MKSAFTPLAKSVFLPLGLTAAVSGIDAATQKAIFEAGMTILIFSSEELDDIMKVPWGNQFFDKGC